MDINFFAVVRHVHFNLYEFSTFNRPLCVIEFRVRNLENPNTEPIGLFSEAGNRRYLWRDRYWSEYELSCRDLCKMVASRIRESIEETEEKKRLQQLLSMLHRYSSGIGPTSADMIDNPISQSKRFHRVLYEINDR